MHFQITQKYISDIPGSPFLNVIQQFRKEDLAILYSGDGLGQSVIARKPLITFTAKNEFSRTTLKVRPDLAQWFNPSPEIPALDQLTQLFNSQHLALNKVPLAGWIGQIGYDVGRTVEKIPSIAADDLEWPMLHWRLFEEYFVFDHASQRWTVVVADSHIDDQLAAPRLNQMTHLLSIDHATGRKDVSATLVESMSRDEYLKKARKIQEYIAAGDIYQANFAQRWKAQTFADPLDIFLALTRETPSPYAALLAFEGRAAISASPELLMQLSVEHQSQDPYHHQFYQHVITRPIKGTRPRNLEDPILDQAACDQLWNSDKDKAELAMIIDLLRNDLGRIAEFGSVHVTQPRLMERHPTIWHTVATIEANLPRKKNWSDIIRALCPGGSITGAPKIRAMQIIEELEPTRRGLYCGNIGTPHTLNIAIRTIQMINNTAYFHAGSGIVADSDPEAEYEECLHKAAAIFRALNI